MHFSNIIHALGLASLVTSAPGGIFDGIGPDIGGTALCLISGTLAAPSSVSLFDKSNFKGRGETYTFKKGLCSSFRSGDKDSGGRSISDWNNKVKSLRLNGKCEHWNCMVYSDWDCKGVVGGPVTVKKPHKTLSAFWEGDMSSIRCYA